MGRTLALANVACLLAKKGKRVLVVDFDLEAPGLITLPGFSQAAEKPGIVDLIDRYLLEGVAPMIGGYTHTCEIVRNYVDHEGVNCTDVFEVDVMPAGLDGDDGYSQRLNRINWNELYNNREGFLLMEEVRAQWEAVGYDYVLIDSRTGLTDVGGICTRQLPDAVVAVFFPNEQNLVGLRQVVRGIRTAGARPLPIDLLFVPSRLPRLDDEHGHLRSWLGKFSDELGYDPDDAVQVEHYDSLMLLNQTLFVIERPNSELAHQYRTIADSLARLNDDDADGAIAFLSRAMRQIGPNISLRDISNPTRLERISRSHPDDFTVQLALARLYYRARDLVKAEEACDKAIKADGFTRATKEAWKVATARNLRLRILSELGRGAEATQDAKAILNDDQSKQTALIDAALALASEEPEALREPMTLPAVAAASAEQLLRLGSQLSLFPGMQREAAIIVEEAFKKGCENPASLPDPTDAQLVLIAGKRFESAAKIGEAFRNHNDLAIMFNTAIAAWALDGAPDLPRWEHLQTLFTQIGSAGSEPNWEQCRALTHAVLGQTVEMDKAIQEGRRLIRLAHGREFSCWTFAYVGKEEFEFHLQQIAAFGRGNGTAPPAILQAQD